MKKIQISISFLIVLIFYCNCEAFESKYKINKAISNDTMKTNPKLEFQLRAGFLSLFEIPIYRHSDIISKYSWPGDIFLYGLHYRTAVNYKFHKNLLGIGLIFRPRLFAGPNISTGLQEISKFYELNKYSLGGIYFHYGYKILNTDIFDSYLTASFIFYSYHEEDPRERYGREVKTIALAFSGPTIFKFSRSISLQIEPSLAFSSYKYTKYQFLKEINGKGISIHPQLKIGINFIIKNFNNHEN